MFVPELEITHKLIIKNCFCFFVLLFLFLYEVENYSYFNYDLSFL